VKLPVFLADRCLSASAQVLFPEKLPVLFLFPPPRPLASPEYFMLASLAFLLILVTTCAAVRFRYRPDPRRFYGRLLAVFVVVCLLLTVTAGVVGHSSARRHLSLLKAHPEMWYQLRAVAW